jgi:transposase InsO family protein
MAQDFATIYRCGGWSLREDMTSSIVIDALRIAWFKRHSSKHSGLMFHSDQGSQYVSKDFRGVLKEYGITGPRVGVATAGILTQCDATHVG